MDDLSKYLSLFVSEASEHAEALAQSGLALTEPHVAASLIDELFRHAHSIKGMSAAMGFDEIVALAHAAEQLLGELRNRQRTRPTPLPKAAGGLLVAATDRVLEMIRARGKGDVPAPVPLLVQALGSASFEEVLAAPEVGVSIGTASDLANTFKERLRGVRVSTELLDSMLETAGELLLGVSRLRELTRAVSDPARQGLEEGVDRLNARLRELHSQVASARLTPLSILTDQLPRHVREIARRTGRSVQLAVTGAEVEIDRAIGEDLADVLLHLLRNCIDHGIEPEELRVALGKSREGQVSMRAQREREVLLLEVADDGRGFDPETLRAVAVRAGRITAAAAEALSDEDALQLACLPGISTAQVVTDISGRGIGLDAVRNTVEQLGGSFAIESVRGKGTTFRVTLPLSVSLVKVLLAEVAGETLALPIGKVQAAVELPRAGEPLLFAGRQLRVHPLAHLVGFEAGPRAPTAPRAAPIALVLSVGDELVAVAIDRLIGQHEAVVKPLSRPLDRVTGLSGVTILGSGQPVFIVEVGRLLSARERVPAQSP